MIGCTDNWSSKWLSSTHHRLEYNCHVGWHVNNTIILNKLGSMIGSTDNWSSKWLSSTHHRLEYNCHVGWHVNNTIILNKLGSMIGSTDNWSSKWLSSSHQTRVQLSCWLARQQYNHSEQIRLNDWFHR